MQDEDGTAASQKEAKHDGGRKGDSAHQCSDTGREAVVPGKVDTAGLMYVRYG